MNHGYHELERQEQLRRRRGWDSGLGYTILPRTFTRAVPVSATPPASPPAQPETSFQDVLAVLRVWLIALSIAGFLITLMYGAGTMTAETYPPLDDFLRYVFMTCVNFVLLLFGLGLMAGLLLILLLVLEQHPTPIIGLALLWYGVSTGKDDS